MKKIVLFLTFLTTFAFSAFDVSGIGLDVSQVSVIGLTIMGALAVIWVIRKIIRLLSPSNDLSSLLSNKNIEIVSIGLEWKGK